MYDEQVKRLRADADYMDNNGIMLYAAAPFYRECADAIEELTGFVQEAERDRDEYRERLDKANDAIEELSRQRDRAYARLCEWCGVCPEGKRNPEDCEIAAIYPEPPKDGGQDDGV